MPSRYCNNPSCTDPSCEDMREKIAKRDAAYLARHTTHKSWCDSLVPGMSTHPCDCGANAMKD